MKMNKKIENIIIFGGGPSGWLPASYLIANLRRPAKITLIEDASAGPIGGAGFALPAGI